MSLETEKNESGALAMKKPPPLRPQYINAYGKVVMEDITARSARELATRKKIEEELEIWSKVKSEIETAASAGNFETAIYTDISPKNDALLRVIDSLKERGFLVDISSGFHRNEQHTTIKISWMEGP